MSAIRRATAEMLRDQFEIEEEDEKKHALSDIFEEEPPTLDTFVRDYAYLNNPNGLSPIQFEFGRHFEQIFYPETYVQMVETFGEQWAPVRFVNELAAEWAKGSGKDYICQISVARISNLLLCLKVPQNYFGMPHQTIIHIMNVAASAQQAHGVFFKPLRTLLTQSNWFKDKFENDYIPGPQAQSIRFKKQIELISGHSSAETLEGKNLLAAIADEISAFPTMEEVKINRSGRTPAKTADSILDMLRSSATTRFPKTFKLAQISYPRFQGDAIEQALAIGKQDNVENGEKSTYFASGPYRTWEVNPLYDQIERIEVHGATALVPNVSAILGDYKKNPAYARAKYEARPEMSENRFFSNDAAIMQTFNNGEATEPVLHFDYYYGLDEGGEPAPTQYNMPEERPMGWQVRFHFHPKFQPMAGAVYAIHGDMAITGDRAGVAMSHVRTWERKDWESVGGTTLESKPLVKLDFCAAFEADPAGDPVPREVQIRWYRKLIWELRSRGFNIMLATFDRFQSADTMQILESYGIESKRVSTDINNDVWEALRDVMYDGRLEAAWDQLLVHEIQRLTLLPNGKVDHPPKGSKDLADAAAGSVVGALELGGDEGETPIPVSESQNLFGMNPAEGGTKTESLMPDAFDQVGLDMTPDSSSFEW